MYNETQQNFLKFYSHKAQSCTRRPKQWQMTGFINTTVFLSLINTGTTYTSIAT